MKLAGGAVGVFIASVYYPLRRWLVLKIPDKYVFRKTVFSFVSHGVFCILLVIAATLVAGNFSWSNVLFFGGLIYALFVLSMLYELLNMLRLNRSGQT